ncbi:MAG TPA: 3-oxoacyl-[acyl-carrier-protein] reductase [Thermomicrobiales bacterium]|nr:3-oxoacyl-[acyl-carrier-protein] reductase [Thermomicrobiales bacterium]
MTASEGKVAIVTGAARGIGRAVALQLAADGFTLVANYRGDEELAMSLVDELKQDGADALAVKADITNADEVATLFEATLNTFGRLDALINNAGITRDTLLMRMSEADWDVVLTTNLKGAFLCSKAAIRPMMRQRSGSIVNLTSVVGLVGNAGQANYAAAKAGLVGFTKSLAKEVGSRGITVNAVAPGFIETRLTDVLSDELKDGARAQIPLGRLGQPEDVAAAVAFLVSPGARYITGHVLTVDGGMFMAS